MRFVGSTHRSASWSCVGLFIRLFLGTGLPADACARDWTVVFQASVPLANIRVDGREAAIHSQGLHVSDDSYYVTGRLETPPKRALLVRFDRATPTQYEYLDITPDVPQGVSDRLDHPGGFCFDGKAFWIPVSASRPRSFTAVVRVQVPSEPRQLQQSKSRVAFHVDDHIGALALQPNTQTFYGANWDTQQIYVWTLQGQLVRKVDRAQLVRDNPEWQLAVQDWQAICAGPRGAPGLLLAGGIDKSPQRDPRHSPAVLDLLDVQNRRHVARLRLSPVDGSSLPLTNEGLALRGQDLYLLPGDLGRDATIYRFQMQLPPP